MMKRLNRILFRSLAICVLAICVLGITLTHVAIAMEIPEALPKPSTKDPDQTKLQERIAS